VSAAVILEVSVFVVGLLFGSFLNVVIARVPRGESVVSPRSRCPECGHAIRWYDNVPVLSWLVLRGRCRDCRSPISSRYPLVELGVAVWFALAFGVVANRLLHGADVDFALVLHHVGDAVLGWLLIGLAVIDWEHQILPDVLTWPGIVVGFFLTCTHAIFLAPGEYDFVWANAPNINSANAGESTGNVFLTGPEHLVYGRLLAVVSAFLILYVIRVVYRLVRKRDGMGLGDAKLLAMIAAFIGFAPSVVALFIGVLLATVYAVGLLARGKAGAATRLPFGSFLAVGGLVAALTGTRLVDAYLALFR